MTTSLQAKRLDAAGRVNRPQATRPGPGHGLSPALDAIEAVAGAWSHDHGDRARWLGWIARARGLQNARRGAFRAAAAAAVTSAAAEPDPVEARLAEVAGEIAACVVELYALAGLS